MHICVWVYEKDVSLWSIVWQRLPEVCSGIMHLRKWFRQCTLYFYKLVYLSGKALFSSKGGMDRRCECSSIQILVWVTVYVLVKSIWKYLVHNETFFSLDISKLLEGISIRTFYAYDVYFSWYSNIFHSSYNILLICLWWLMIATI